MVSRDAGSEDQVEKLKARDELKRKQQIEDLKALMGEIGGRTFAWRLLEQCGVYRSSFSSDPLLMAFDEGRRSIGLWLIAELAAVDPSLFALMQQEDRVREFTENQQAEAGEKEEDDE